MNLIPILIYYLLQLKSAVKISTFVGSISYIYFKTYTYLFEFSTPFLRGEPSTLQKALDWYAYNEDYILVVLFTIAVDYTLGTWKYLKQRDFVFKKNIAGLFTKMFIVLFGALLFEGMNIIIYEDSIIKEYLTIITRLIVFIYPARSAFRSMSFITKGKFPPKSWIDKMDKFEGTLNPQDLGNTNKQKQNENTY